MLVVKFLLRFLEPALRSNPRFALSNLRRLELRLRPREGGDDDTDRQDREEGHQRQERTRRQKQPRGFGLGAVARKAAAPETALARHRTEIIVRTGPFIRRRL